ncbi:LPXTG cell wall anchor domain-containing protein [Streptomyces spongiicola]|uniref:LPXTG cell wall anchor domain-containing protein n=1 Tax=Streptomyces spongiicola TaxID=1690221 RepID=A0A388T4U0_9ACTN|nr:LPXTG cell wall anchor domain-containing protein [Streptomyces spongiicola]GBQ02205.1 LPXTG cell wall anchor domain-containing protein [Streptomyces spongiicola]
MKLRRAMAVAAATAVIAPAAFLAAPAAYATTGGANSTSTAGTTGDTNTTGDTDEDKPGDTDGTGEQKPGDTDDTNTTGDTGEGKPGDTDGTGEQKPGEDEEKPGEDEEPGEFQICETDDFELSIKGLPGKIAAGSGWHEFSMNAYNNSDTVLTEIDYFAGASSDKDGMELFKSKQVALQVFDEESKSWENLSEGGEAVGYVGQSSEVKPGYEVDIPLRINVKSNAPVGAGFTLGGGLYIGDEDCLGYTDVAYKFQIVSGSADTDGTEPQEGGKAPIPTEKPAANTSSQITGSLAETGSSSTLPAIGIAGGVALVAGAGVVFAMKRRRGDAVA